MQAPARTAWLAAEVVAAAVKGALFAAVVPPTQQDANTRSFKMLHEYLEAARTGPRVPVPYRFHFFVRTEPSSGEGSSEAAGAAGAGSQTPQQRAAPDPAGPTLPPGLREVTVTLPPPTRGAPGEVLSGSARKAFGTLLAALGLPSRIGAGDGGQEADEYARFVSLRDFLPQAVEEVHQHAAAQVWTCCLPAWSACLALFETPGLAAPMVRCRLHDPPTLPLP